MTEFNGHAGQHIMDVIDGAIRVACSDGAPVWFMFNGVKCTVDGGTDREMTCVEVMRAIKTGTPVDCRSNRTQPVSVPVSPPDMVPTIYGPIPRAFFVAHPEVFDRLFAEHPEIFAGGGTVPMPF
jgi:hypothetical protein